MGAYWGGFIIGGLVGLGAGVVLAWVGLCAWLVPLMQRTTEDIHRALRPESGLVKSAQGTPLAESVSPARSRR